MRSTDQITIDQCIFGSSGDLGTLPNLHPTSGVRGVYAARSLLFFHESGNITITNNMVESGATIMNGDRWGTLYGTYIKTNNVGF